MVKKLGGQVGKVGNEWKMVTHIVGDGGGGKVGEGEWNVLSHEVGEGE